MKRVVVALLVGILGAATQANAWGAKGHQIVSYVGATAATQTPFFTANADAMRQLSTVPDRIWKGAQTKAEEAPNHWFQADAYISDLKQCNDILSFPKVYSTAITKYGQDTILKNGTAPWRIQQLYAMAVSDFKKGDMKMALEEAGAMSHYIGDLSQPLHVSENYDGQNSGNKGIHAWFETQNIGDEMAIRAEVLKRTQALLADRNFVSESTGDLADVINHEIIRSIQKRDEVLMNDSSLGRASDQAKQTQLDLAETRMADGAAVLTIILSRMTKDAGLQSNMSVVPIQDPDFIKPDFSNSSSLMTPFAAELNPALAGVDDADCQAL